MTLTDHFRVPSGVWRRPLLGPLLFGLVLGGVPYGVVLVVFGNRVLSSLNSLTGLLLSLFAILVAASSAALGASSDWKEVLGRTFLTSISACIPIPAIVYSVLLWKWGDEVFDIHNLPFFLILLAMWSGAATIIGLLVALIVPRSWRSRE